MIINPKIESLKPSKLKLEGYFISANNLKVLRLTLKGLKVDTKFEFDLYPVNGQYNEVKEDSFFLNIPRYQKGLTDKLLEIGRALNQESILAILDIQPAIVFTDVKKPVKFVTLESNTVLHRDDVSVGSNDHSLIDLGGAWYQLVVFK